MKIITLTFNPAFDVHCYCKNFKPYHESIAQITAKDAGGKGVNISRALKANGTESLAVVVVGKENGSEFCQALEKDGLSVSAVWVDGRIRENITLHEDGKPETRISFEGFSCSNSVLAQIEEKLGQIDGQTVVTFTGSLPKGISSEEALAWLDNMRKKGAKIVIDSRSVSFAELLSFKPWLIKPNKDEAEAYTQKTVEGVNGAAEIARSLYQSGIENVLISLGGDGAVLSCAEGTFIAQAPNIDARSTIGAGDSMLAGFISGVEKCLSVENTLKKAVAFGTAACMREGTLPPQKKDVESLEELIFIRKDS